MNNGSHKWWHKPMIYGLVALVVLYTAWSLSSVLADTYEQIMLNWS